MQPHDVKEGRRTLLFPLHPFLVERRAGGGRAVMREEEEGGE